MDSDVRPGDVVLVRNTKNLLSKIICFVTGSVWSHTAVGFFPLRVLPDLDIKQLFEAQLLTGATAWSVTRNDTTLGVRVYRITDFSPADTQELLAQLYIEHNMELYGWYQLPWFIYRRLIELLHLPRRWALHNWFPWHRVCSGILQEYLEGVREWAAMRARQDARAKIVGDHTVKMAWLAAVLGVEMDGFHPQSAHPKDIEHWMDELVANNVAQIVYERKAA